MPSWMPGEDYYTDFHKGDPYVKVDQGFARLPGAGYAALHPELEDVNPEDYPDIHKMAILADVAPYSREYNTFRLKVGNQARDNTELQIEYEKILERVRQTRCLRPVPQQKTSRGREPSPGAGPAAFLLASTDLLALLYGRAGGTWGSLKCLDTYRANIPPPADKRGPSIDGRDQNS